MDLKYDEDDEDVKDIVKMENDIGIIYVDPFDFEITKNESNCELKTIICTEKDFSLDGMMTFESDVKPEEITSEIDRPLIPQQLIDQKLFTCSKCPVKLKKGRHLKTNHQIPTGEKRYLCDHCSKSFSRKAALREHLLRYFGDKNYSCTDGLKNHMRKHTDGIAELLIFW